MTTISSTGEFAVPADTTAAQPQASLRDVLRNRNFRLLWLGEGISLLGDQFYMIALPWLVLQLTGDPLTMGTVMALGGIPRALFMLVGGALTDRFSPRAVMLASNLVRLVLTALLSVLVLTGLIQTWMIYIFALVFGLADAFFFPANSAVIPQVVEEKHLPIANSLMQGTAQLSLFAGPALAGALIAIFAGMRTPDAPPSMEGIAIAFAFDALTFLASVVTLWWMSANAANTQSAETRSGGVLASIREGLVAVWRDVPLRSFFIMIAVSNVLINGPLVVGIPVLADTRLPEGAAAFGLLMSAYGGGSLVGILLAGMLPQPPARRMGLVLSVIWSGLGIGVALLGSTSATLLAALVMLAMGLANGYVVILFMTWLQRRTPAVLLGRVMSLLMLASVGLMPISTAVTGALIKLDMTTLFVVAGSLMTVLVLLALLNPAVRAMEPPAEVA